MAEYIEREAAIRKVNGEFPDAHYPSWYAELLKEIPSADVQPVVRCRECRHWRVSMDRTTTWCSRLSDVETVEHDFCSFGERKMDAEEET